MTTETDFTLDDMLAAITAAWDDRQTPDDLRERLVAWSRDNAEHVNRLRALVAATLAWWIIKGAEAGHDRDILEQTALQVTDNVICHIAYTMKRRQGEPFSPARCAIVTYAISDSLVRVPPKEVDIEAIAALADGIAGTVEQERDHLRELIEDIADMDLGDPEMEHRDIIARCRQEQKRWTEAATC